MNTTTAPAAQTIKDGDKAFTSHGVGTYMKVLGGMVASPNQMWLFINRDDGGVQVEVWTVGGEFVRDATHDAD